MAHHQRWSGVPRSATASHSEVIENLVIFASRAWLAMLNTAEKHARRPASSETRLAHPRSFRVA